MVEAFLSFALFGVVAKVLYMKQVLAFELECKQTLIMHSLWTGYFMFRGLDDKCEYES